MSDRKFTGGDSFPQDCMEYRTYLIMMKSELRNGAGAYEVGNAEAARSGPSFGPFQCDIGSNQDGRDLLESIATGATDAQGNRILSDKELESVKGHFYKPFSDFTATDSTLYDQLKPKLNAALSSDVGVKAMAKTGLRVHFLPSLDLGPLTSSWVYPSAPRHSTAASLIRFAPRAVPLR